MDWSLHHQIAQTALKLRILDFDLVGEILTDLGARAAAGEEVSVELWCIAGWLSPEQLKGLLVTLNRDELAERIEADGQFSPGERDIADKESAFEKMDTLQFQGEIPPSSTEERVSSLGGDKTEPETETDQDDSGLAEFSESPFDIGGAQGAPVVELGAGDTWQTGDFQLGFEQTGLYRPPESTSELLEIDERYELGAELGQGGGGRVVEALDRRLKRRVAMKLVKPAAKTRDRDVRHFLAEAQAACQLEHPNIIPVYDVGVRSDGSVFYTMLLIRHHSLQDVLNGLRSRDADYLHEYSLSRLLTILIQVSQAIDFAHDQGVIHRDLKPGNIMIGEFGEVLVMDWGLAHVRGDTVSTELSEAGEDLVTSGQTLGTPAYMSPEQARGSLEDIDERSDVYSLGAILYEILALEPPFEGDGPVETMWNVLEGKLIRPEEQSEHGLWEIPEDLERICLHALERKKSDRLESAGELAKTLEGFMSGVRPRRAQWRLAEGRLAVERYLENKAKIAHLTKKIGVLMETMDPWEPIERKRELWNLEKERDQLVIDRSQAFGEAVSGFQKALANDDECVSARTELAELYWERYCEAETTGDEFGQIYFGGLVRQTGDEKYLKRLSHQVSVRVETRPAGAETTLFPLQEIDRRLVVTDERKLGTTPVTVPELEVGSYFMVLQAKGRAIVRAPLYARRGEALDLRVNLPSEDMVSSGFVFVAGGPCFVGGDPEAINPRARRKIEVSSFFCARLPVTFREYLQFLNDLELEEAKAHAPYRAGGQSMLAIYDESKNQWFPNRFYSDLPAERRNDGDEGSRWNLPVVGINAANARAYCRWRSKRDGKSYRLPTEHEWEKAGRGVDGRFFPWGDRFDATFCKMQKSRDYVSHPEPVGTFVDDVSPYGVRDLSGGVREWCEPGTDDAEYMPIRGGAWDRNQRDCRLASTRKIAAIQRNQNVGMRLVYAVEFDDGWTGTQRVRVPDGF